jgi:hypothetical protein
MREQNAARILDRATIGNGGVVRIKGSLVVDPGGDITLDEGDFNAANITASSTVTGATVHATGTVVADAGITSVGVYGLDVSTLPGTRRTNWTVVTGQIGYAPSSILTKNILGEVQITAAQFLACGPVVFEYLGQVDIRDNPENPNHDPNYVVPTELGHIAEWLEQNECGAFVFRHEDGSPAGINYAEFAAVGFVVVGRNHEARLQALERSSA